MCWSLEVSLFTSCLVVLSVAALWLRNAKHDRWNAIFLAVFGSMQVVDVFFWLIEKDEGLLATCTEHSMNHKVTLAATTIIILEPFASLAGRMYGQGKLCSLVEAAVYIAVFYIYTLHVYAVNDSCFSCSSLSPLGYIVYFFHPAGCPGWHTLGKQDVTQAEIPLELRIAFLIGMVYPYLSQKGGAGLLQSAILTITWFVGYFSDAHASVWCNANVAQAFTMLLDPYLFAVAGKAKQKKK